MHKFWYDYVETKYGEKATQCYTDIYSSILYRKPDDIYKDILEVIKKGLTLQIMTWKGHYRKKRTRKLLA